MSLSAQGRKDWDKILREEGLESVRIKWPQEEYSKEGAYLQQFIQAWIKNEEEKRLLLSSKKSNKIAISAVVISVISLVANILLTLLVKKGG